MDSHKNITIKFLGDWSKVKPLHLALVKLVNYENLSIYQTAFTFLHDTACFIQSYASPVLDLGIPFLGLQDSDDVKFIVMGPLSTYIRFHGMDN